MAMDLSFSITLPRAAYTVGVARQFLRAVLDSSGIGNEIRDDILAAAAEACANAIDHGSPAATYDVIVRLGGDACLVQIFDGGGFFDPSRLGRPGPDAESGRGVLMMRALVDHVALDSSPQGGTTVSLHKWLEPLPGRIPRQSVPESPVSH